jgi:Asp-tRNA(Asn)/Glu-tRNA(Gln) amidotransferase A subunit family amidase
MRWSRFSFPLLDYLVPCYYILTTAEASSNLSRYDGVRYGYRSSQVEDLESLYKNTPYRRIWPGGKTSNPARHFCAFCWLL